MIPLLHFLFQVEWNLSTFLTNLKNLCLWSTFLIFTSQKILFSFLSVLAYMLPIVDSSQIYWNIDSITDLSSVIFRYHNIQNKEQNRLLTRTCCKPTDQKNFLHYTCAHPRLPIKSMPHSQVLRLNKICTETSELSKNMQMLKESFINWGFNEKFLDKEVQRLSKIEKNTLPALRDNLIGSTKVDLFEIL